jgi:hypothetical protein
MKFINDLVIIENKEIEYLSYFKRNMFMEQSIHKDYDEDIAIPRKDLMDLYICVKRKPHMFDFTWRFNDATMRLRAIASGKRTEKTRLAKWLGEKLESAGY